MKTACETVQGLIQQRLDGETLGAQQQAIVAAHLAICADCRSFQRDLRLIIGLVERLPDEPVPAAFVSSVMERLPVADNWASVTWRLSLRIEQLWAPLTALIGLVILLVQTMSVQGISVLNLPAALIEWAQLADWSNLESVMNATSLLALSLDAEFVLGVSLLAVAIFAIMMQVLSSPPPGAVIRR